MFWVRVGIAVVAIVVVLVLTTRHQHRRRSATLDGSTLRRRVTETTIGFRRIDGRLRELGFRMVGDFELLAANGRRIERVLIAWNDAGMTLALRGRQTFAFFTELEGSENAVPEIVVETSVFDVDHTHPRYVVQTLRGAKDSSERSLLRVHDEAVTLLGQEGWDERRRQPDPVAFAHRVLVDSAAAATIGTKRPVIQVGNAARRFYADGTAQVGAEIVAVDPAEFLDESEEPW